MNRIEEVALSYVGKSKSEIDKRYPTEQCCAATVCSILDDAGVDVYKSISCTQMANAWDNDPRMQRISLNDVQGGNVLFFDWDKSGDCDHTAIVVEYDGNVRTGLYYVNGNGDNPNGVTKQYMDYATLQRTVGRIYRYVGNQNVSKPQENVSNDSKTGTINFDQISNGSKGKSVKILQALLIASGYSCGTCGADGDFGGATEAAVRNYQREHSLSVDGIAGPQTWGKLLS